MYIREKNNKPCPENNVIKSKDYIDFIILIATSTAAANFIKLAKKDKIFKENINFLGPSFVSPDQFRKELGLVYPNIYFIELQ